MQRTVVSALLLLGLMLPHGAAAQALGSNEALNVILSPSYPRPYQTVTVTVKSTLIDLSASTVVISANGVEAQRGTGVVSGQVRVAGPGERTTITVTATNEGQTYQKQLVIRPADVALILEPLTTSHPFYDGGSLISSESRIRVVAIPDIRTAAGTRVSAQNLVYTWRLGDQTLEASSGIGRSSFTATAPVRYRSATLSLTVNTQDKSVVAASQVVITPTDPIVRIYRNDPLLGPMFDRAYSGVISMLDQEETFRVVPYHFSAKPSITWLLNSVATGNLEDITVRSNGAGNGSALLSATAKGATMFQNGESSLTVRFGETKPLGIFGL